MDESTTQSAWAPPIGGPSSDFTAEPASYNNPTLPPVEARPRHIESANAPAGPTVEALLPPTPSALPTTRGRRSARPWILSAAAAIALVAAAAAAIFVLGDRGEASSEPTSSTPTDAERVRYREWVFTYSIASTEMTPGGFEEACGATQGEDGAFMLMGLLQSPFDTLYCQLDLGERSSGRLIVGSGVTSCEDDYDCGLVDDATITTTLDGELLESVSARVPSTGSDAPFDVDAAGRWVVIDPLLPGVHELTTSGIVDGDLVVTTWSLDVADHLPVERFDTTDALTAFEAMPTAQERACEVEDRTIRTAIEAFWAINQVEPTGWDDLVPDLLREQPDDWELVIDGDERAVPQPDPAGACASFDPES